MQSLSEEEIKTYDVKTAFLHRSLSEGVHIEFPDGYEDNKNRVCKLKRSIYGLKQDKYLTDTLFNIG